jgi:hypothetical protein
MVETRAKNATTHPGAIVTPRTRRSSAEVAQDNKVKTDVKTTDTIFREQALARIAELEAQLKANQWDTKQSGRDPPVSTKKKVTRAPQNKAKAKKSGLPKSSGSGTIDIDMTPLVSFFTL